MHLATRARACLIEPTITNTGRTLGSYMHAYSSNWLYILSITCTIYIATTTAVYGYIELVLKHIIKLAAG